MGELVAMLGLSIGLCGLTLVLAGAVFAIIDLSAKVKRLTDLIEARWPRS